MKVLITGGAGFIGSRLSLSLVRQGYGVVILDNLSEQVHGAGPPRNLAGASFIRGDVRDPRAVAAALAGVEVVYHLAAETGVGQSQYEISRYVSVNVHGAAVVLQACATAGIGRLILASSRAVYGEGCHHCGRCGLSFQAQPRAVDQLEVGRWGILCPACGSAAEPLAMAETGPTSPTSVYGLTKLQQEELAQATARACGLRVTVLRLFNVFGPGQALGNPYTGVLGTLFTHATRQEGIELYEDGEMIRDFVFVDDVVEVLAACLVEPSSSGRIINVGTGRRITLREVARAVCSALGVADRVSCRGRFRLGDVRHAFSNPSIAANVFRFTPSTSFEVGLGSYVTWALSQKNERNENPAEKALLDRGLLRQSRM